MSTNTVRLRELDVPKLMQRLEVSPTYMELALGEGTLLRITFVLHSLTVPHDPIMQITQDGDKQWWGAAQLPGIPDMDAALLVAVEGVGAFMFSMDVGINGAMVAPRYVQEKLGIRSAPTAVGVAYLLSAMRCHWVGADLEKQIEALVRGYGAAWDQYDELPSFVKSALEEG